MANQIHVGRSSLVLEYKWELSDIERRVGTTLSKMIIFRGEKLFRVGLKNEESFSTLLFMTFGAAKMGIDEADVSIRFPNGGRERMNRYDDEVDSAQRPRRVHLYTYKVAKVLVGSYCIRFELYISSDALNYPVRRLDTLFGQQMWQAAVNQAGTDYEMIAEGKRFFVHKFVLAARSPVFAALFAASGGQVGEGRSQRLRTSFGDESCLQQFLKFIYTGELDGAVSHQLKELAETYEIKTLQLLCESAMLPGENLDEDRAELALLLKTSSNVVVPVVKPDAGSEIDSKSVIFTVTWTIPYENQNSRLPIESNQDARSIVSGRFGFDSAEIFSAKLSLDMMRKICTIYFLVNHPSKTSCTVERVDCSILNLLWKKTKLTTASSTGEMNSIQMFTFSIGQDHAFPKQLRFHVQMSSTIPNYDFKFRDQSFQEDLWGAARALKLTDFVFLVGSTSFPAHRSLLAARSPVFAAMLNSGLEEARTGQAQINDTDPETFALFLRFLYVGELEDEEEETAVSGPMKMKLFTLADKYQVETLMKICQTPASSVDMEETMDSFLSF